MPKYHKGQRVEFRDVDERSGKSFQAIGPIESVDDYGIYTIINEKCEPKMVCFVEEVDIIKVVRRSVINWTALVLCVIAIIVILGAFLGNITNPTFLIAACVAAFLCVVGAVAVLIKSGNW